MQCGVGDYTARLASAIESSGNAEVVILSKLERSTSLLGVEIIQIQGWKFHALPEVLRILSACKPDVVHIQFPTQGYADYWLPWMLPIVMRIFGFRVVQTWHEFLPMGGHRRSFLPCIACDTAIVVRPNYIQNIPLLYRLLLKWKRIVFIPNGSAIPKSLLSSQERVQMQIELRKEQDRVVTYFGFANPNKGVELIFQIADPNRDQIVLLCDLSGTNPYQQGILDLCNSPNWRGKVTVAGFLPADEVADILAASDAVVLPFPEGGGSWNSSISAALEQGTLVITTSNSKEGYDPDANIFYSKPGEVGSMAHALVTYGGRKIKNFNDDGLEWTRIANAHLQIYSEILIRKRSFST